MLKPDANRQVRAFAPATVANVAAAFDILGFALSNPGDEVIATLTDEPSVRLVSITGDEGALPLDPKRNTASAAIISLLEATGSDAGIDLELSKGLPLCSGLGSSAASSAAALTAVNALLGEPMTARELLPFAVAAEAVACGVGHADNAAPCLLGGCILVRSTDPLDVISLPVPEDLACVLVHPHCEVRTADARMVLRNQLTLTRAVEQWGNVAGLVAGLCLGDLELLGRSLSDVVIEPTRSILIPGFEQVKRAAMDGGALGCSISGSGPTLFALVAGDDRAEEIGHAMATAFLEIGLGSDVFTSMVGTSGAHIVEDGR
ncbi:MAG: homoserine kinase [bacterium]|nr:homoserine kinase [bacterium]